MRRSAQTILLMFVLGGCWQQQGLTAIDLSAPVGQVDAKTAQAASLYASMDMDVGTFDVLFMQFITISKESWDAAFPVDLYRHAVMACLTQPLNAEVEPSTLEAEAAARAGIGCAVLPLPALETALEGSPQRDAAYDGLRAVDALREKRAILDQRLRALPRDTQDAREYVASQRVEARRVGQELQRRKPEYASDDYETSSARVVEWLKKLDALEAEVDRLESNHDAWEQVLQTRTAELYRGIALLGAAP